MKIESLRDLFETELCYAYDCEQKLVKKGLPTMIEAASSPELRLGLEQHLQETRSQVSRSEEHTSELQSPCNLVCRLLLEKKNDTGNVRQDEDGGKLNVIKETRKG